MIEIKDVHKSFGPLEVLKGINLTVKKGEVVSVIGGSGSGKSTLLTCINGLEQINSGSILVDGTEVHAKTTDINKLRRHNDEHDRADQKAIILACRSHRWPHPLPERLRNIRHQRRQDQPCKRKLGRQK